MENITASKGDYIITTDRSKFDIHAIHDFLSHAYWSKDIPFDTVKRSIENSLCFGVFHDEKHIGFARIITDYATIAYLGDVYILPEHRGHGLSKWLMEQVTSHPELQGLRRWILATRDAHKLYEQFGWTALSKPDRFMERFDPDVYAKKIV